MSEHDTPRVSACIEAVMLRYPSEKSTVYFTAVHQELAPLARELERENADLRAALAVESAALADAVRHVGNLKERLATQAPSAPAAPEMAEMEARKDAAYLERNQVVAALAKCFPSGATRTAIEGWSEDWHGCVYIDLPTGQASWHFHDSQAYLFDGLPPYVESWDGHDTPEKYRRLAALSVKAEPAAIPDGWKLVPENPTGDMFRAANKVDDAAAAGGSMHGADDEQIWHAMYFAAPTPPTTGEA